MSDQYVVRFVRRYYSQFIKIRFFHFLYSNTLIFLSRFFESFIRKHPRLIVFGASNGMSYGDNSRFLFEWIIQNCPDKKCVWLTHRKQVRDEVNKRGYSAELIWSIKGIINLFRAHVGCYTNTLRDLSFDPWFFPFKIKLIALRHGKSVKGVQESLKNIKLSEAEIKSRNHEKKRIVAVLSTSDLISDMTESSLNVGMKKMFITGYPRNDSFFLNLPEDREKVRELVQDDARKIILYAPSWRNGREPTRFFPFDDFDKNLLVKGLEKHKLELLLRPHPNDLLLFPEMRYFLKELTTSSRFIEIADNYIFQDMYSILPFVDCLITDYSATYHDFLLTEKPMWFISYDYDGYKNQNGFLYDYIKMLPGPRLDTFHSFLKEIGALLNSVDIYAGRRHRLLELVHLYKDGNSCKRTARLIDTFK